MHGRQTGNMGVLILIVTTANSALKSSQWNLCRVLMSPRQIWSFGSSILFFFGDMRLGTFKSRMGAQEACCVTVIPGLYLTIILDFLFISPISDSLFPESHFFFLSRFIPLFGICKTRNRFP